MRKSPVIDGTRPLPHGPVLKRPRCSGFTLIELLVASAILLLLVVILAGIFSSVSKTSQMGYSNNERIQNILATTDFIRGELRSALLPINRPDTNNLQLIVNPSTISSQFKNPQAIFWQAPTASDQTLGDVAEVGYFVKWNTDNPANPRPSLCRFSVANSTAGTNFLIYSGTPWLSDSILNSVAPADKAGAYEGLIAENVVALFVQSLDSKGQPISKAANGSAFNNATFDSRQGYTDAAGTVVAACALPPLVRLGFVVIDTRSAAHIGTAEQTALTNISATDAADYVAKALASPQLKGVSPGLRSYQTEINLLNAR